MPKRNLSQVKWNTVFFAIAAVLIALDQWTKHLIQGSFYPGQSMPESGFFRLTYVQNTGAAFSIFLGGNDILAIFSMIGILLILFFNFYLVRRYPFLNTRFNKIAVAMILGGTVGNLIDRLSLHWVRDFIDVGPWPIFNVADSSTVVGTILFAISILFLTPGLNPAKPSGSIDSTHPQPPAESK
jgi:signal peptidase II